ncbi:MAG: SHOCT domain-containing protein [Candidatus Geothermincolia bacterium]
MQTISLLAHFGHWDAGGGSWIWMALMMLVGIAVIALVIWSLLRIGGTGGSPTGSAGPHGVSHDPFQTARHRYAAGEITREELREIERTLRGQD